MEEIRLKTLELLCSKTEKNETVNTEPETTVLIWLTMVSVPVSTTVTTLVIYPTWSDVIQCNN